MDLKQKSYEKIKQLIEKGAEIPNPGTIDIGDDVNIDQISGKGVRIYPGCRIYGSKTVISSGCQLGYEGPATIDNCRLGPKVELKGGFFSQSVFCAPPLFVMWSGRLMTNNGARNAPAHGCRKNAI